MFNLDISTIRLCAAIVVFVTLVGLSAFWRFKNFKANAAWWGAGIVIYCLAFIGTLFGPAGSNSFLSLLVGSALAVSSMLFLNAVRVKLQKPPLLLATGVLTLLVLAISAFFTYAVPNPFIRNQIIFLVSGALTLITAAEMLCNAKNNSQKPYLACAVLFLIDGLFNLGSFLYLAFVDVVNFNFFTFLMLFTTILIALLNHAFILMAYDDVRQDLDWALQQLRHESELKLKSVQDRWVLALEYGKSGAWEVNLSTAEVMMSPHWANLLGLPPQELRTTTVDLMHYMHPDDVDSFLNLMKELELGHSEFLEHEHRLRRSDGSWIWVCSRGRIIHHPDLPDDAKLVGIDIDITESRLRQVQLEQAIAASDQAKEVALQASKAKTTFLTNISHEIRTPMNAILGFSQLMLDDSNLNEKQKESLEIITSSGVHLMSLIDDILNLSRVQSGHFIIRREETNPTILFHEISDYFQKRNVRTGVSFETVLSPALPHALQLDPKAIRQICMNLLSNAFKYTQSGRVELKVDYLPGKDPVPALLVIAVSDTGVGIREEHLGIIFNVFEQGGSQSFTDEGVGLGLAICKDIVTQLDGRLDVKSRPNEGSCFTASIPVDEVRTGETALRLVADAGRSEKPQVPSILIVDDIESNRKLLQRILGDKGFEILEASNANDAMALIRSQRPSLVLMDIRMPVVAGDQAIIEIRKDAALASMPVIAITANAFEGEKERLLAIGANEFISKPFMRDEILQKIGRLLEAGSGTVSAVRRVPLMVVAAAAPPPAPAKAQALKVLVVDDNPANQQLLIAQLRTLNLHADAARNGREAFNSWSQRHYDIVLTDCAMPLLDGFALAKLIRQTEAEQQNGKATLIIAVTGSPEEYSERCLEAGMNDLLGKPVLLRVLVKTLGRYLPGFREKQS